MIKLKEFHKGKEWNFALSLKTAYEYYPGEPNSLHVAFFGYSYWFSLPEILKPKVKWVDTSKYEFSKGNPNAGYTDYISRKYGFSLYKDTLHVYYGIQPGRWSRDDKVNSDHSKCFFLPWANDRRIHIDYMNPDGTLFERYKDHKNGRLNFDEMERIRSAIPKIQFSFNDFDGEENVATCYLETAMYRKGTSWCKFLGYLFPPKFYRKMDIEFVKETGRQKKSWKGGTMGTSCNIETWETPLEAFTKYGTEMAREKHYGMVPRGFANIRMIK